MIYVHVGALQKVTNSDIFKLKTETVSIALHVVKEWVDQSDVNKSTVLA